MTGGAFIDAARGEFVVGDLVLPVADAEPAGALRLFSPAGPVLRPITFGERFRLVERAALAADPVENLCAAIMKCATVSSGEMELSGGNRDACQTLALLLAGAGIEAPPFAESMLLVGGSAGWRYREIEEAEASRIDYLARRLEPKLPDPDDGWSRVVFEEEPAHGPAAIRRDLATRLLSRFADPDTGGAENATEVFGGTTLSGGPAGEKAWMGMDAGLRPAGTSGFGFGEVEGDGRLAESDRRDMSGEGAGSASHASSAPGAAMEPAGPDIAGLPAKRRAKVLGYTLKGWEKRDESRTASAPGPHAPATEVPAQIGSGSWGGDAMTPDIGRASSAFAASHDEAREFSDRFPAAMPVPPAQGGMDNPVQPTVHPMHPFAGMPRSVPALPRTSSGAAPRTIAEHDTVRASSSGGTGLTEPGPRSWSFTGERNDAGRGIETASSILGGPDRPEENGVASIIMELADALAELLHEEADLRGIDR